MPARKFNILVDGDEVFNNQVSDGRVQEHVPALGALAQGGLARGADGVAADALNVVGVASAQRDNYILLSCAKRMFLT